MPLLPFSYALDDSLSKAVRHSLEDSASYRGVPNATQLKLVASTRLVQISVDSLDVRQDKLMDTVILRPTLRRVSDTLYCDVLKCDIYECDTQDCDLLEFLYVHSNVIHSSVM